MELEGKHVSSSISSVSFHIFLIFIVSCSTAQFWRGKLCEASFWAKRGESQHEVREDAAAMWIELTTTIETSQALKYSTFAEVDWADSGSSSSAHWRSSFWTHGFSVFSGGVSTRLCVKLREPSNMESTQLPRNRSFNAAKIP